MKTIQPIPIWDNGITTNATIINAYAVNVTLGTSATFYYTLYSQNEDGTKGEQLKDGNVFMNPENYALWNTDDVAWDFIAVTLNLTITGDYVPPVPPTPII